jgi:NNP family nitrate/nitrite transporter-like MFS transporter
VPLVIVVHGGLHLQNAGLMWLVPIVVATFGAFFFMNNLATARSNVRDQLSVARNRHTWIMAFLYIGTFGSFVGYSAAFPLLVKTQFPAETRNLAFLGALVGSVARPLGGWLADRIGGARVTQWNFGVMGAATLGVIYFVNAHDYVGFLTMFLLLFVTTGIGNGSTFRMIPAIFRAERGVDARTGADREQAMAWARRDGAAVIGISSAIGALGGFFIPRALGASIKATHGPAQAFELFFVGYVACVVITWWCYRRSSFMVKLVPSLAHANA